MTPLLTRVNRFVASNQSTQPVDNSGEKFGATGRQPGQCRGQRKNKRGIWPASSQAATAGPAAAHIPCGRPQPIRPGTTAVVPTVHRAYCDYVLFFSENQTTNSGCVATAQPHHARQTGVRAASWTQRPTGLHGLWAIRTQPIALAAVGVTSRGSSAHGIPSATISTRQRSIDYS